MKKEFRDWLEDKKRVSTHSYLNNGKLIIPNSDIEKELELIIKKYDKLHKQVVIPQWVADSIESKKKVGTRLNVAMSEFPEFRLEKELDINEYECNELYARAWLDGYEVKEEQKYVIKLPMSTNRDIDFALVDDKGDIWVDAYPSKYKLTEQEILSLPKGDVYFKYFSEPVEERE